MACRSLKKLIEDIESEGFDYALAHYDDYSEIPSQEFQTRYKAYLQARHELIVFLGIEDE